MAAEQSAPDRLLRVRAAGLGAVVAFSALLGVFAAIAFAPAVQVQYAPAWGRAVWIGPGTPAATAYYRRELTLQHAPEKAHLQIAAPDGFDLFVNGQLVTDTRGGYPQAIRGATSATATLILALTSRTYNVAPYLKAGKNVLAVKVSLQSRPPRPELIVNGAWQDAGGQVGEIASDEAWRVRTFEEWQAGRRIAWHAVDFGDELWPLAARVSRPLDVPMEALDIYPSLFQVFPRGDWIWSPDRSAQAVAFRRSFDLSGRELREAWLGIATNAQYTLAINGHPLPIIAAEDARPNAAVMRTFDVTRYLQWGPNTIDIGATSLPPMNAPRLAAALMVGVDAERLDFSSDRRWLVGAPGEPHADGARGWMPAALLGAMSPVPLAAERNGDLGYPAVRVSQLSPTWPWWLPRIGRAAGWVAVVLAVNLALVGAARALGVVPAAAWRACVQAGFAGVAMLVFVFYLQFDVRVLRAEVLQPAVFLAAWLLTLAWAAFAAWPRR